MEWYSIMKNLLKTVFLLSCFTLIFAACSSNEKPIGKIESTGKLAQNFHTLKDLKKGSKLAVEVSVIETLENIVYEDVAFTISKARILSSTKGNLKPGDEIKILETGGTKNGVVYAFNGIPVMKPGENLYLF
jgi:hypothetical protein